MDSSFYKYKAPGHNNIISAFVMQYKYRMALMHLPGFKKYETYLDNVRKFPKDVRLEITCLVSKFNIINISDCGHS